MCYTCVSTRHDYDPPTRIASPRSNGHCNFQNIKTTNYNLVKFHKCKYNLFYFLIFHYIFHKQRAVIFHCFQIFPDFFKSRKMELASNHHLSKRDSTILLRILKGSQPTNVSRGRYWENKISQYLKVLLSFKLYQGSFAVMSSFSNFLVISGLCLLLAFNLGAERSCWVLNLIELPEPKINPVLD